MLLSLTKRRWHVICLSLLTLVLMLTGLSTLPVIDRDEARFAQASVQMAETNDLMNIKLRYLRPPLYSFLKDISRKQMRSSARRQRLFSPA